jgi:WD40 repeat protein
MSASQRRPLEWPTATAVLTEPPAFGANAQVSDLRSPVVLQLGHSEQLHSLLFSPDGRQLATSAVDGRVCVWDARSGDLLETLSGSGLRGFGVAYSPDGKRILTDGEPGQWLEWDAPTGRLLRKVRAPSDNAPSPRPMSGLVVRRANDGGGLELEETRTWRTVRTVRIPPGDDHVAQLSRDRRTLVTVEDGRVIDRRPPFPKRLVLKAWDLTRPGPHPRLRRIISFRDDPVLQSLALSPDGHTLAGGSVDYNAGQGRIILWDLQTGRRRVGGWLPGGVMVLAFSPDGKTLASANEPDRHRIRLWDVRMLRERAVMRGVTGEITSLVFAPGDAVLLVAHHNPDGLEGERNAAVARWDLPAGALAAVQRVDGDWVAFAPDGRRFESWSRPAGLLLLSPDGETSVSTGGRGGEVHLPGGEDGQPLPDAFYPVAFSPDGKRLATGTGRSETVALWDVRTRARLWTLGPVENVTEWELQSPAFSPDGRTVAAGTRSGAIRLWELPREGEGGQPGFRGSLRPLGRAGSPVESLAFSPDGRICAGVRQDGLMTLWDTQRSQELRSWFSHPASVNSLVFARSGRFLASADEDGTVRLWDPGTGRLLVTLVMLADLEQPGPRESWLAFTPEGYYDGSPGAGRFLRYRTPGGVMPQEGFECASHRPELVRAALEGRS